MSPEQRQRAKIIRAILLQLPVGTLQEQIIPELKRRLLEYDVAVALESKRGPQGETLYLSRTIH